MAVEVSFVPGNKDLRRLGYVGVRARPWVFWSSVGFFVILPLVVAMATVFVETSVQRNWVPILVLVATPMLSAVVFYNIPVFLFRKSPALLGEHIYTFDNDSIRARSPALDTRISWQVVTSCFTHSFGLLFFSGKAPVISIPRRALSRGQEAELLELIAKKGLRIERNA